VDDDTLFCQNVLDGLRLFASSPENKSSAFFAPLRFDCIFIPRGER
jgi:hypothetical protein